MNTLNVISRFFKNFLRFFFFKKEPFFLITVWMTNTTTEWKVSLLSLSPLFSFLVTSKEKHAMSWEYCHHCNSDFSWYHFFQEVFVRALEHRTSGLSVSIKHLWRKKKRRGQSNSRRGKDSPILPIIKDAYIFKKCKQVIFEHFQFYLTLVVVTITDEETCLCFKALPFNWLTKNLVIWLILTQTFWYEG